MKTIAFALAAITLATPITAVVAQDRAAPSAQQQDRTGPVRSLPATRTTEPRRSPDRILVQPRADGRGDIIVAPGNGGGPLADIVTGPGFGGGPRVAPGGATGQRPGTTSGGRFRQKPGTRFPTADDVTNVSPNAPGRN